MESQDEDQVLIALIRAHAQNQPEKFMETATVYCQELTQSLVHPENYGLNSEHLGSLLEMVLGQSGLQNKLLEAAQSPPMAPDQFLNQVESNLMPTLLASISDVVEGDMPQELNSNLIMQLLRDNFGTLTADNADPAQFISGIMSQVDSIRPDRNRE